MIKEQMMLQLDYLYEEAQKLKDFVNINGVFWKIEDAELKNNILGMCSHDTIFINKRISNKDKQKVIFHELIHALLITFDPENNTENNVRNIESEYYEQRLHQSQFIFVQ